MIPQVMATPDGWRHIYDGQNPSMVNKKAQAIVDWVEGEAPNLLQRLRELLDERHEQREGISLDLQCLVAIASARFVTPRKSASSPSFSLHSWTQVERDSWTSPQNQRLGWGK